MWYIPVSYFTCIVSLGDIPYTTTIFKAFVLKVLAFLLHVKTNWLPRMCKINERTLEWSKSIGTGNAL